MRSKWQKTQNDLKKLNSDMYLFYAPDIRQTLTLPEEESQHCVQVLRTTAGQQILITDGTGTLYHAEITNPHRKHCEVRILSEEQPEPLHEGYIHIAIAPTKNIDRLEWMIEKCTEMGVDEITPLLCRHSERKTVNEERLKKIMVAAAKQSLKTTFPRLNPLTPFAQLAENASEEGRFIAHCMTEEEAENLQAAYKPTEGKNALWQLIRRGERTLVLIGPEGDFSPEEVAQAVRAGFIPCSLGKARLRTETAGVFACNTAVLLNS